MSASHDDVTTGFPYFSYYASPHIGATAWYLACTRELNPFWNIPTDQTTLPIPVPRFLLSDPASPCATCDP